jgi:hypothetical protein
MSPALTRLISPQHWVSWAFVSILIGGPSNGYADFRIPRLPFTLEQAARQAIAAYDLIIEGEVGGTSTDPIDSGEYLLATLTILNISNIWGTVSDDSIKVHSRTAATMIHPSEEEGWGAGQATLPTRGAKGIFLLVCEPHDARMIKGTLPTLCNPGIDFLVKDDRDSVIQNVTGHPFRWGYSELVSELTRQAQKASFEALVPASEVIISGEIGSYNDRDVDSTSVIYPLSVQHVFHGHFSSSSSFLAVPYHDPPGKDRAASLTQGIVNRSLSERQLKPLLRGRRSNLRVLVLGRVLPNGAIAPLSFGCLEIDANGFVRGPAYRIASGQLARSRRSLNDLRKVLQSRL